MREGAGVHNQHDLWGHRGRVALLWGYSATVVGFYALLALRSRGPTRETELDTGAAADDTLQRPQPLVSIIVPARDEERNIVACVTSLLEQDYPAFEVLVVDDGSTDGTPQLLEQLARTHPRGGRLQIIRVESLPAGWAGKPHAIHTGALQAKGDWLLFTDADTRHAPNALRTAVARAQARQDDLLSFATTQDLPDFWGRVLMPLAYMGISFQYPARQVNDPNTSLAIANGQFILVRAAMYRHVGGYAAPHMRATVLDDRDLAREVKRAHGRLELVDGRGLVHTRMYQSLGEHWRGWGKNAYLGSRGGPLFFLLMIVGLPAVCIGPFALLLAGLVSRRPWLALAGGLPVAATVAFRTRLNRELQVPWRYVWTHPLAAVIFTGILARSAWRVVTGRGVDWRGRIYHA